MGGGDKPNLLNLTLPQAAVVGPFLRFGNYDPVTHEYTASVLIVLHPRISAEPSTLHLTYGPPTCKMETPAIHLDTYEGYTFWRFNLSVQLTDAQQTIDYVVPYAGPEESPKTFSFVVPSSSQPWRWMFYSCNGFHGEWKRAQLKGIQPLWNDVLEQHSQNPFHAQVGGGDQIYNDPLWDGNCPSLLQWRAQTKEKMHADQFSEEMSREVSGFYFMHYCRHFCEDVFKDALASIPFVFTWDDHDIFDGWGSYPEYLQNSFVFQGIYQLAKRFYLLFQQHTTEPLARELNKCFGKTGFSEVKVFGNSVALWVLDNRSERTRERVATPETYVMAKERLEALPPGLRHVIVVTTVPIVFPKIPMTEEFMAKMSGKDKGLLWGVLNKTGIAAKMVSAFDEPNLLDDLMDHWTAAGHQHEKKHMLQMMQDLARSKQVRVSFISGDVHLASIGRFYSYPKSAKVVKIGKEECEDFRDDFRFMPNITSSAIGNEPPPDGLLKTYELFNTATDLNLGPTREKMVKRFKGGNKKFHNTRNYCVVEEYPYTPESTDITNGCLDFILKAEDTREKNHLKVDIWHNFVPMLTTSVDKWAK